MDSYQLLKLVHIISATLLFGTGLGTAFFLHMADRSANLAAIQTVTRSVIMADWLFTTPAVVVQPVTGYLLMQELGYALDSRWFILVTGLYLLAGLCWLPVVYLQMRLRTIAVQCSEYTELPLTYHRLLRRWRLLGIPAFASVLLLFGLMVFKPWIQSSGYGQLSIDMMRNVSDAKEYRAIQHHHSILNASAD